MTFVCKFCCRCCCCDYGCLAFHCCSCIVVVASSIFFPPLAAITLIPCRIISINLRTSMLMRTDQLVFYIQQLKTPGLYINFLPRVLSSFRRISSSLFVKSNWMHMKMCKCTPAIIQGGEGVLGWVVMWIFHALGLSTILYFDSPSLSMCQEFMGLTKICFSKRAVKGRKKSSASPNKFPSFFLFFPFLLCVFYI